jgi:serine/threonine protein kinase
VRASAQRQLNNDSIRAFVFAPGSAILSRMPTRSHPGLPKPMLGQRLGPFRLKAVLGEGGMGLVYRAVREPSGEVVAVKVLKRALSRDEVYRRRFEREARAASQVEHRHLVPVLEAGEDDGVHYLAMAYVDGRSLGERIEAEGRLDLAESVRIVGEVASGLDALHAAGLVHRDVKPSNVMLGEDGAAALTDFGLARGEAFTVLTRPGEVMGTLDYLAPELISGTAATPSSDIYALGCVAYVCVTGSAPFAGRGMFEVAVAHVEEEPPDPAGKRPDLPSAVAWGLLQALAKDPARRPTTARAYARMLSAGLATS